MSMDESKDPNHNFAVSLGKGQKLKILLAPKPKVSDGGPADAGSAEDDDSIMDAPDVPDALIPLLAKKFWTFLDLGTRLRTVEVESPVGQLFRELNAIDVPSDAEGLIAEYVEPKFDAPAEFDGNLQTLPEGIYDPYSFNTQHLQVKVPAGQVATLKSWDELILGAAARRQSDPDWRPTDALDPFKTTKLKGKAQPNCLPLPYGQDYQPVGPVGPSPLYWSSTDYNGDIFDVILYNDVSEDFPEVQTFKYPNSKYRESVRDIRKAASMFQGDGSVWASMEFLANNKWSFKPVPTNQTWNSNQLPQNNKEARMNVKNLGGAGEPKEFNVKIDTRLAYESFDTGDLINYKVTETPFFEGPEVPFKLTRKKAARFFLKPSWLAFCRGFRLQYSASTRIYTYRYGDGPGYGGIRYNHSAFNSTYDASAIGVNLSVQNFFNGDDSAGPTTSGTITLEVTDKDAHTGVLTYPGGSLTVGQSPVEVTFDNIKVIAWIEVNTFQHNGDKSEVVFADAGYNFSPQYFINLDAKVRRGVHIGRWPVVPKNRFDGWDSPYTWNGSSNYSDTYFYPSPLTVNYFGLTAAALPGRDCFHYGQITENYKRSAFRDTVDYVYNSKPMAIKYQSASGQGLDVFYGGRVTPDVSYPAGTNVAAWQAEFEAAAANLKSQIEALPHVGLMNFETQNTVFSKTNQIDILPLDAPAGLLCGVIEQGKKYYIWRKTSQARGGYDYNRNQGLANHNNTI